MIALGVILLWMAGIIKLVDIVHDMIYRYDHYTPDWREAGQK